MEKYSMQNRKTYADHWLGKTILLLLIFFVFFSIPFLNSLISRNDRYGLPAYRPAPDFQLTNSQGEAVSLQTFRGKFVFLMFGYLSCDSLCHSQALLFQEINEMADNKSRLAFVYIGIDPERDRPSQLAGYFDKRGENFTSLNADNLKSAQQLAANYKAFYAKEKSSFITKSYMITHPGFYYLIGPDGKLRFTYAASQVSTRLIIDDLHYLIEEYNNT